MSISPAFARLCQPATSSPSAPRNLARLAVIAAGIAGAAPAALGQENWANDTLKSMATERVQSETARSPRVSAVERMSEADDDEMRPQRNSSRQRSAARRTQRGPRVASLGREVAPARAPSALEGRRTPEPRAATAPQKPLGALVAALGRDMLAPAPIDRSPSRKKRLGPMVASLGRAFVSPAPALEPSLSGGPIAWVASSECLADPLRRVLAELAAAFGAVRVNSTCRSRRHNARVGGAKRSYHLTGNAADFRVAASPSEVHSFLRKHRSVGGLKHYGLGLFHIDTGPRRSW